MKSFLISVVAVTVVSGLLPVSASDTTKPAAEVENWTGYEGGSRRLNASAVTAMPEDLHKVWQRSFAPLKGRGASPHTARNIVCVEGQIAVVAGDLSDVPTDRVSGAMVTILSAATGQTKTCVQTPAASTARGLIGYPLAYGCEGHDTGPGMLLLHWDLSSGILFLSPCGDASTNAAILPLANITDYRPGKALDAVPAYGQLAEKHPGLQDAQGRTRAQASKKPLGPFDWLGGNTPNQPAFLDCDPQTPLLAKTTYAHMQSSPLELVNKYTGQNAWTQSPWASAIPGWVLAGDPLSPQRSADTTGKVGLRLFAGWGSVLTDGGRLFLMGPGPESPLRLAKKDGALTGITDASHRTNVSRRLCLEYPDAGLVLHAYNVAWEDRQPNDGAPNPQALDTAVVTPAWAYYFPSAVPVPDSPEKAESYLEVDGFYRNKAWLVDGAGVWATWKPSKAGSVQLIHADDSAATTFDLGVGAGLMGQDIWPHLAMARANGHKLLVYYYGAGQRRRYTPCSVSYKDYQGMDPYTRAPFWDARLLPPAGEAQIAVFDAEAGKVLWTQELSAAPKPPANDHMGYLDKSIMVVAGELAYVGWVDLTGTEAALQLAAFSLTGPRAAPTPVRVGLGFKSADAPGSFLNDLIAVNGTLFALVTQGANLTPKPGLAPDHPGFSWTAQHVIAVASAATAPKEKTVETRSK